MFFALAEMFSCRCAGSSWKAECFFMKIAQIYSGFCLCFPVVSCWGVVPVLQRPGAEGSTLRGISFCISLLIMFIRFFYLSNALTFVLVKKFSIRRLFPLTGRMPFLGTACFFLLPVLVWQGACLSCRVWSGLILKFIENNLLCRKYFYKIAGLLGGISRFLLHLPV